MNTSLPWNKMNDFLLDCGGYRESKEFGKRVMNKIEVLIPFDQARLYFLNDNGTIVEEYLLGVDKQVSMEYHEYYSQVDNGNYAVAKRAKAFQQHYPKIEDCIYSWDKYGHQEVFFQEYVQPLQLHHSFGLGLRDIHGTLKCMFSLDRICDVKFSKIEMEIMHYIRSHLDNLYQNFYVTPPGNYENVGRKIFEDAPLTAREAEVAELLMQGVIPIHISQKLCISITTVNKHIANMHAKLNVSTRQELIVKLLSCH